MAFDSTISLGNVLTALGTFGGILVAYHRWDKRIEIRHVQNLAEFEKLNAKIADGIDKVNAQVDRVESKVDETRRDVNGSREKLVALDRKVEKHLVADELVQNDLLRRLDRLE